MDNNQFMGSNDQRRVFAERIASKIGRERSEAISDRMIRALERVPREEIVLGGRFSVADPEEIYTDSVLVVRKDNRGEAVSTVSQPSLVVRMLELLDLQLGQKVLEIGAGSGYNAALIAELVGDPGLVTTVEIDSELARSTAGVLASVGYGGIKVVAGDGWEGAGDSGPFDRIEVTLAAPGISRHWVEQIVEGGVAVVPVEHGGPGAAPLFRLIGQRDTMRGQATYWTRFVSMRGRSASSPWPDPPSVRRGRPDTTIPLTGVESVSEATRPWSSFAFFLIISESGSWVENRIGIRSESGSAVIEDGVVEGWGDEEPASRLAACFRKWVDLGCPELTEWDITFGSGRGAPPNGGFLIWREDSWEWAVLRSDS